MNVKISSNETPGFHVLQFVFTVWGWSDMVRYFFCDFLPDLTPSK